MEEPTQEQRAAMVTRLTELGCRRARGSLMYDGTITEAPVILARDAFYDAWQGAVGYVAKVAAVGALVPVFRERFGDEYADELSAALEGK